MSTGPRSAAQTQPLQNQSEPNRGRTLLAAMTVVRKLITECGEASGAAITRNCRSAAGRARLLDAQAQALAQELGHLPLALSHAAVCMIDQQISCAAYLARYGTGRDQPDDLMTPSRMPTATGAPSRPPCCWPWTRPISVIAAAGGSSRMVVAAFRTELAGMPGRAAAARSKQRR